MIIAPDYEKEAIKILEQKKNRIVLVRKDCQTHVYQFRSILNGVLWQDKDLKTETESDMNAVTERAPEKLEIIDLEFANKIVKQSSHIGNQCSNKKFHFYAFQIVSK